MITSALRYLLKEKQLSARQVSDETGISRNTLSSFVTGTATGIRYDTLDKLCRYLNVTPSDLLIYSPYNYEININPFTYLNKEKADITGTILINPAFPLTPDLSTVQINVFGHVEHIVLGLEEPQGFLAWDRNGLDEITKNLQCANFFNMYMDFTDTERQRFKTDISTAILNSCNEPIPLSSTQSSDIVFKLQFIDEMFSYTANTPVDYGSFFNTLFSEIEEHQKALNSAFQEVRELIEKEREDKITWKVLTQSTAEDPDPTENQPNE